MSVSISGVQGRLCTSRSRRASSSDVCPAMLRYHGEVGACPSQSSFQPPQAIRSLYQSSAALKRDLPRLGSPVTPTIRGRTGCDMAWATQSGREIRHPICFPSGS